MREAKYRLAWIQYATEGRTGMDGQLVVEFGFLQLRLTCELIALGGLALQDGTNSVPKRLHGSYSADEVMRGLERLNAHFFPEPLIGPVLTESGFKRFDVRTTDVLSRTELLHLYTKICGTALHRGSLKNILKERPPVRKQFPELTDPMRKLTNLLEIHRIGLAENRTQILCWLNYGPEQEVRTMQAEAITP